jgi:probable F420-dependent oxidoreductase
VSRPESFPLVGLLYFATDRSLPLTEFARAAADRGFDSVLLPEHTHIPVSSAHAYPADVEIPERYLRILDPYIGLATIAAQTQLRIGTCISLIAQHDPIALAKAIATLDLLSGGRFTLGVGFGWNLDELANHGRDVTRRRSIVREYVATMRTLWCDAEAEYDGAHVKLAPSWAWPKPMPRSVPGSQQSTIPVLLGCAPTPRGLAEVVNWADGWIPGGDDTEQLATWLTDLRSQWTAADRDRAGPIVWPMQTLTDDEKLRSQLGRFQALGVDQVVLDLQVLNKSEILPVLDRYARVVAASRG